MITKIIACSDIHVPSLRGIDDLKIVLQRFINACNDIVSLNGPESTRIVVAGDIFENKLAITNESILTVNWFFKELDKICKTIVIAGNHDLLMNNLDRVDSISPIIEIGNFENVVYLDRDLGYKSGLYKDENVVWCLYSTFDSFNTPSIKSEQCINSKDDNFYIGLIHGDVNGAVSCTSFVVENGLDPAVFDDLDFVIAGHIHKFQEVRHGGVPCVYCSSMKQQCFGESITEHGFVVWNLLEDKEYDYENHEVEYPEGGYFEFGINSIDEIENDEEELINL